MLGALLKKLTGQNSGSLYADKVAALRDVPRKDYTDKLRDVYQAYNEPALDKILGQQPKPQNYKNREHNEQLVATKEAAQLLKKMKQAELALQAGDIAPVVKIADDNWVSFALLTEDVQNPLALKAKVALWDNPHYHDRGELYYNQETTHYGRSHALQAVQGFNDLGMADECESAMRSVIDNNHAEADHVGTQYLNLWLKGFHEDKPETGLINQIAVKLALEKKYDFQLQDLAKYDSDKIKPLSLDDYDVILKRHPDDKVRQDVIAKIGKEAELRRQDFDTEKSFGILLNHVKTAEGQPTVSQQKALKLLDHDLYERIYGQHAYARPSAAADAYYEVIGAELQKANPAVLDGIFGDVAKTDKFVNGYNNQLWLKHDEKKELVAGTGVDIGKLKPVTILHFLPADLEGEAAAQARNHIAGQMLKQVGQDYLFTGVEKLWQGDQTRYGEEARQVATLSRHVLLDTTLPASSQQRLAAEKNLHQLIITETMKIDIDQKNLQKMHEANGQSLGGASISHDMIEHAGKHVAERQAKIGYGQATLEALEASGIHLATGSAAKIASELQQMPYLQQIKKKPEKYISA